MKKIIFLIGFLFSTIIVSAQQIVYDTIFQTIYTYEYTYIVHSPIWTSADADTSPPNYPYYSLTMTEYPYNNSVVYCNSNYPYYTITFLNPVVGNTYMIDCSKYEINTLIGYYRLEIYFKSLTATSIENTVLTSSIKVYPNPFIDNINLKINALEASKSSIIITDVLGKIYEYKEVEIIEGENNISFPVTCSKGLYFLSLVTDNKTITYKIIK